MNATPISATGTPIGVNVHIPSNGTLGSTLRASTSCAWTTRLVLVPISVQTPPRMAA